MKNLPLLIILSFSLYFFLYDFFNMPKNINIGTDKKVFIPKNFSELVSIMRHHHPDINKKDIIVLKNNLNKILSFDEKNKIIHVECGININQFVEFLDENNLAVQNMPLNQLTNINSTNIVEFLPGLIEKTVVLPNGTILSNNKPFIPENSELYSVKLQLVNQYMVSKKKKVTNWKAFCNDIFDYLERCGF